ncbi:MAG TPA: RES domain-containing protein [Candidatus Limnocylindrales bacterium]|nr:RES domain-containing protein [Candidatus Limnocylindrales bacterium]
MIVFRHADPRFPFLWESSEQPPARWHGPGEGPTHYFSSTVDAAWAEFLRHEEITDPADLAGIERALWAVELADPPAERARLERRTMTGGPDTYEACRREAGRLREHGAAGFMAPSAAVDPATGSGLRTDGGLRPARRRSEWVFVLFGPRPDLIGWAACATGAPRPDLLRRVRPLG